MATISANRSIGLLACGLVLLIGRGVVAAEREAWTPTRFEVGARVGYIELAKHKQITRDADGNVTGGYTDGISIDTLDVHQRYNVYPFARFFFTDYIGIQASWEGYEASALADGQWPTLETHKDGDVKVEGPSIQAVLRAPLGPQDRFVPSLGLGVAILDAEFIETPWWGVDNIRRINADDTSAFMVSVGCAFRITRYLQLDASWDYMMADVDVVYYFRDNRVNEWTFPLNSHAFEVGLAYTF